MWESNVTLRDSYCFSGRLDHTLEIAMAIAISNDYSLKGFIVDCYFASPPLDPSSL